MNNEPKTENPSDTNIIDEKSEAFIGEAEEVRESDPPTGGAGGGFAALSDPPTGGAGGGKNFGVESADA